MQTLSQKAEALKDEAIQFLISEDKRFLCPSKHIAGTVILIEHEEIQFTLDGDRYLTEIDIKERKLIDNNGYQYDFDLLTLDQLLLIVDTIKRVQERIENFERDQLTVLEQIQDKGFNVVTCGSCGSIILHETTAEEIYCGYCEFTSEPCDFPDYHTV